MAKKQYPDLPPLPEKTDEQRAYARELLDALYEHYPNPHCALDHDNPFELLCATILSAQCTDVRVNKVTPDLFAAYPTPKAMADAPIQELEELVRSTGFYRNKAKALKTSSEIIVEKHDGDVPQNMKDLLELYGVARGSYEEMRPGITGLWQVSGRNDVLYAQRVAMDVDYLRRMSLGLDLWIMLRTALVVVTHDEHLAARMQRIHSLDSSQGGAWRDSRQEASPAQS